MSPSERVRRFVDAELSPAEREELLEDAEHDAELAEALADARFAMDALAALEPEPPEIPRDLVDAAVLRAVQRKAVEEQEAPWWRRALRAATRPREVRVRMTPSLALVAAAALVVGGLWVSHRASRPQTALAPAPAAQAQVPTEPESPVEVAVRLMLPTEGARTVAVAGDFNEWATDSTFLEDPEGDGVFVGTLRLSPGSYAYMFVVDGERWVADPYAVNHRDDGFGNRNAVLRID